MQLVSTYKSTATVPIASVAEVRGTSFLFARDAADRSSGRMGYEPGVVV